MAIFKKGGLFKFGWQIDDANRLTLSYRLINIHQIAPSDNNLQNDRLVGDTPTGIQGLNTKQFIELITNARNGSIHMVDYKYSPLIKQNITDQSTILDYSFNPNSQLVDSNITLYHNSTLEREKWLNANIKDFTKYITDGVNIRNSSDFDWLYLTYGIDYAHNKISTVRGKENSSFESTYRPSDYNGSSDNLGAYLQGHIPLFDKKLVLSSSLRYDYYKTNAHGNFQTVNITKSAGSKIPSIKKEQILNNPSYNDQHISPSFAITWKPVKFFTLGLKYNEAFRAPSLQESFANGYLFGIKLQGILNGYYKGAYAASLYPNLNLKPEVARNKEIDASFHFDDVLTQGDNVKFTTAYFINDIKDMIDAHLLFAPQGAAAQYVNIPKARIQGFELGTKYQTENLAVGVSYGKMLGKVKETNPNNPFLQGLKEGDPLDNIPASRLILTADYYLIPQELNLGTIVSYYSHQDRVSTSYQRNWGDGTPFSSYVLAEVHTSYTPKAGRFKNLRIDFAIDNLLNQKYRPAFGLIDGAGRNFKLNLSYKF